MTASTTAQSPQVSKLSTYFNQIKDRFHLRHNEASKWLEKNAVSLEKMRASSQQLLTVASLAGAVAINQPVNLKVAEQLQAADSSSNKVDEDTLTQVSLDEHQAILDKMNEYVQRPPGHLPEQEELYLEQQLSDILGFDVTAELDGHQLNHSIGIMGAEQHLPRFPGDTIEQHDVYQTVGITQNRGAFGWFTQNGALSDTAIAREKYYFAVQTMYLPTWNTEHAQLKPWYAFRKMIVINPAEQVAAVGVIGDAGPAQWVQKQFGGSPEVIREAKIWSKLSQGRVILLFVDDPENKVPLGILDLSSNQSTISNKEGSHDE